jgi:PAS domain S-box-containing protein
MIPSPGSGDEARRLDALQRYGVLDTLPEQSLDDLTALAAHICDAPISLISLVDDRRQWFKSSVGWSVRETPREVSFCAHALGRGTDIVVVPDATLDPRFARNPLVLDDPRIRFYAGAPLVTPDGHALGTLCVIDRAPRQLAEAQGQALRVLGRQVMAQLDLRRLARGHAADEAQLRMVLDGLGPTMFVGLMRTDGVVLVANRPALEAVALRPDEVIGRPLFDTHTWAYARPVRERLRQAITRAAAGEPVRYDERIRVTDGQEIWVDFSLQPLRDETGRIAFLVPSAVAITKRKDAEAALRETEARRTAVMESSRDAVVVMDHQGRITECNGAAERMFGHPVRDMLGREVSEVMIPPWLRERHRAGLARYLGTRESPVLDRRIETTGQRADGSEFPVELTIVRVGHADPPFFTGFIRDITGQRRAEARIQHLNRVYAVLSDINQTIVREKDPDAMLGAACRIAVEKGGFRLAWVGLIDAATGRLVIRAHSGADAGTLAIVQALIDARPPAGCAFTFHALQRGEHGICDDIARDPQAAGWREAALAREYRSMAAFPLKQGDRVIGTFNIYAAETGFFDAEEVRLLDELAADISFALDVQAHEVERQLAEEERRAAEARFRQLAEHIQQVFWMIDASTRELLYVSPAYETIWGRTCESLYASPDAWIDAVHPDDRARVVEARSRSGEPGQYDEVYRIARPDGSTRWIRDRAFPIRHESGALHRIVGTATDVTEQRQLEWQFRQAQKMESVGRLAGGIAHDFNNLLAVINGLAELAVASLPDDDPLRQDLEEIRLAGDRAAALTRQLLALSRRQILKPEVLDLSVVIGDMRNMLRRVIGEDVDLVFDLARPLGSVNADPSQIEQVLLNLVINARDAMPDGGTLRIETRDVDVDASREQDDPSIRRGPSVRLTVSDTGAGMDETTRQRVFEPFFTTKALGKGTGLGLSTVYGIVQQSGGSIWFDSEPGRGTSFTIQLPRVTPAPHQSTAKIPTSVVPGTETILLVEDERAVRDLTKRVLQSAGYTVLAVSGGAEALDRLQEHPEPVHLMLTDVVMPGMNGRELAARAAGLRPEMKVLYTSGYTDDEILRHGVLDDPLRFMSKPYSPAELTHRVRDVLDS